MVQEVDMNASEHEHPEDADASVTSGERGAYITGTIKESTDLVMEEVVANQDLREDLAAEGFSVSEVLQQTQLVHSYGSSVQEMVHSISESKT